MKSKWKNKLPAVILLVTLLASSCNQGTPEHAHRSAGGAVADDLHSLLKPVNSTIVSDIHTVSPVLREMTTQARVSGAIVYDTRRAHSVPLRFGGRIERLHVHYNFERVSKGQKLLEIYSPEIVTAQSELLYLLESDPGNTGLIAAARQKLQLLGLTPTQIDRLAETGEASYSLTIYSPYSGYLVEELATAPSPQQAASPDPGPAKEAELSIREGMYQEKGQTVFRVINTDRVVAEFSIYPETAPYIKTGDSLRIIPDNDRESALVAKVDFVEPFFQEGGTFSKVRVYLDNPDDRFKPGELVTAHFQSRTDSVPWVPEGAVVDLGTKKVAFLKEQGAFHPVPVQTGRSTGGWTEIVSGLSPADTIAYDGHFMVDSEGFIQQNNE